MRVRRRIVNAPAARTHLAARSAERPAPTPKRRSAGGNTRNNAGNQMRRRADTIGDAVSALALSVGRVSTTGVPVADRMPFSMRSLPSNVHPRLRIARIPVNRVTVLLGEAHDERSPSRPLILLTYLSNPSRTVTDEKPPGDGASLWQ